MVLRLFYSDQGIQTETLSFEIFFFEGDSRVSTISRL